MFIEPRLPPPPSKYLSLSQSLLTKLMTDSPTTHCNFTLNLRGTNSTVHPQIHSLSFLFLLVCLSASLFFFYIFPLTLTPPCLSLALDCFLLPHLWGLCKSINKITSDPVPTAFCSLLFISRSPVHFRGLSGVNNWMVCFGSHCYAALSAALVTKKKTLVQCRHN